MLSHARAERDAVPENREWALVQRVVVAAHHLARDFRRDVQVSISLGRERSGLVDDVADRRGVHPDRARKDHPSGVGPAGRLEDARRTEHVQCHSRPRIGEYHVDVGRRREMENRARSGKVLGEGVGVEDVGAPPFDIRAAWYRVINDPDRVPRRAKSVDHMGADESGAARDGDEIVGHERATAAASDSITISTCSSVSAAEIGRHTWRAQVCSAPGNEPFAQGRNTGCRWSGVS
jgi:hypothetical protein